MSQVSCMCGTVRLDLTGDPIIVSECYCNSCREAAERLSALPGAPTVSGANGSTHFVLFRKDRVRIFEGFEMMRHFRLGPDASTRRVVATCCNTPVLLEFKGGHWASLYGNLWHGQTLPTAQLRTVTGDLGDYDKLDGAVPSGAWATTKFYGKLLAAWVAMGFKAPELAANTPEIALGK